MEENIVTTTTVTTTKKEEVVNNDTPTTEEPKSFMGGLVEDNSGGISSIRILMLMWGLGVFLVWGSVCITAMFNGVYILPTLPTEIVTILLGITGIKTVQRFGEK